MRSRRQRRRNRSIFYNAREKALQKEQQISPGDFIMPLSDITKRGYTKVVLFLRVSSQGQRRNLKYQEHHLKKKLEEMDIEIVAIIQEIGSGKKVDRPKLHKAVEIARKHGSAIVTESIDRLLRSAAYSKSNQEATPSEDELNELVKVTEGIQLVNLLHPYMSWTDVRGFQSTRKQKQTGRWVGRPKKQAGRGDPARKKLSLVKVKFMLWLGASLENVAKIFGVSHTTVMNWRNEMQNNGVNFQQLPKSAKRVKIIDKQQHRKNT